MGITYQELNPSDAIVEIDNREFTLRAFDLTAQVWAYNHFATPENKDGMTVLANRIADINDADAVLQLTWHLLKRKVYFGNYDAFVKAIDDHKGGKWTKIMDLYGAVVKTLGVSQPQLEEIQEELELKKSTAAAKL